MDQKKIGSHIFTSMQPFQCYQIGVAVFIVVCLFSASLLVESIT